MGQDNDKRQQVPEDVAPQGKLNPGDQAAPGTPGTGENVCRRCHGTGKIGATECAECGGTGVVIEEIGGA